MDQQDTDLHLVRETRGTPHWGPSSDGLNEQVSQIFSMFDEPV